MFNTHCRLRLVHVQASLSACSFWFEHEVDPHIIQTFTSQHHRNISLFHFKCHCMCMPSIGPSAVREFHKSESESVISRNSATQEEDESISEQKRG